MSRDRSFSPLFILVAMIAVVAALYVAKQILLPIALAVLLSFLFTPLANRFERWGMPRVPAVIVVVLAAFSVLGILGWIVTDQLVALRYELPEHRTKIIAKARAFKEITKRFQKVGDEITGQQDEGSKTGDENHGSNNGSGTRTPGSPVLADAPAARAAAAAIQNVAETGNPLTNRGSTEAIPVRVTEMPPSPLTQAQSWLGWLAAPFTTAGMVFVLVFFMLLDRENQRNRVIQLFGKSNLHATTEAITDATQRVGRYLRMQFLINAGYGIAVATGLGLIGVPSAMMWGVLGFTLRFLPYLGPWLAAILPMLVTLAVSEGWTQPLLVAGMYLVYELVLNNVAEPMLYGSSTGVSTVGVVLSAIFWTWLWGPVGLILAMPATVCLVVTARYVPQLHFITVLLADQPPLSPAERVYQRLLASDYHEPLKIARNHVTAANLVSFYDDILIPALALAERDRHTGRLSQEEEAFVYDTAEDIIDELGDASLDAKAQTGEAITPPASDAGDLDASAVRILCVSLRDRADEATSRMLTQLLITAGFTVVAESSDALTSEVVERVAETSAEIVVISVLPPVRPRDSRLLWKRLRQRYPDLPIVVGYWTGPEATESLLPPGGDATSKVASTLAEALSLIRATAAKVVLAKDR